MPAGPLPPPPSFAPGPPPPEAPGGTVTVRLLPDGEEIVLTPTGWARLLPAAFLAFWLCGWALGEAVVLVILLGPLAEPLLDALRTLAPGLPLPRLAGSVPWPVLVFLAVWLIFWTWGGLGALWQLLRLLAGSDRFLLRPGGVAFSQRAGPFRRTRRFDAREVAALGADTHRSRVVARVGGQEVVLTSGTPEPVAIWLAARLRAALGLPDPPVAAVSPEAAGAGSEPPVPRDWAAERLPEGGVRLAAPPARSRKVAGCALTVATLVTAGFVVFLLWLTSVGGRAREARGLLVVLSLATLGIDLLCLWLAKARESWLFQRGLLVRTWQLGPWLRQRPVSRGSLAVTVTTDSDGDDWFRLEARGEGPPFRMESRMNDGPGVLAFARYAAWHTGFPLDLPREVRIAAREELGG